MSESKRIEIITADGDAYISADDRHAFDRKVALARLTGACPLCDGSIDREETENQYGEAILVLRCEDCEGWWMVSESDLPDSLNDNQY